ncbi:MAG: methyltransferase domain-containing protein [Gammaproteobacteria bacterium]|nr:methyltransferase domain-containing protein [Gammaproteobacteria bacterium]
MKNKSNKISAEYSKAIKENKNIVSATGGAKFADYSTYDLVSLPEGVAESSFGCGNPLAFSSVKKSETVLDLGCGAGLDLLLAAEKVGPEGKVIGVDMNEDMLKKAKKNIDATTYKNIELRKGMIENLPVESSSIDWVISNCVINLSTEKEKAFNEIARVLKPNGQMLVSDIVSENMPWWVKRSGILTAACAGGTISEKSYLQGLMNAGMIDCNVISRQYYEPKQMASIVVDLLPSFLTNISCCGKSIIENLLIKMASPIAKNLWSAKFYGRLTFK